MKPKAISQPRQPLLYVRAADGAQLESLLSPLALRSSGHHADNEIARILELGRNETAGSDRLPFERDRDRIIHCRQFRKLAGKTQLLIAPNRGDLRTRLTHTMEVYQVATSIARRFNLNIPAVEAIALGHDIGHTPFGHAGEEALDKKLKCIGGFHHASHSVRSLDYTAYDPHLFHEEQTFGLNLTFAVREGILKHGWFIERKSPYHLPPTNTRSWNLAANGTRPFGSIEAQTVALADEVAYLNHDIEDLTLYGFEKVLSARIVHNFFKQHNIAVNRHGHEKWLKTEQSFLNLLSKDKTERVKWLIRDAVDNSVARMEQAQKGRFDRKKRIVDFGESLRTVRNLFYSFFRECIYTDVRIEQKNARAKEQVVFLYDFFEKFFQGNPDMLPAHVQRELQSNSIWWRNYLRDLRRHNFITKSDANLPNEMVACKLAACDVVADLTDKEAIQTVEALCEPESGSGMQAVDRILSTFSNERQLDLNHQRQVFTQNALRSLFSPTP